MGSTSAHMPKGGKLADFVLRDLDPRYTVLASKMKRTSGEWQYALYSAIRNYDTDQVFALVTLIHRSPSPHVYHNVTYKYVDESMGPFESDCPAEILDLLTEPVGAFAIEWRARCRQNLANPATTVKAGAIIEFANKLRFGDGVEESRFTLVHRNDFRREGDGRLVRIGNWRKNYSWKVAA